ncbi:hypothetical protein V8J88_10250 [Massilia sp. W12]|uniref:hypothetical protein n=1 Tax=Massilia sp. W12 TaxID=3126507 RepID=UPI0030D4A4AB
MSQHPLEAWCGAIPTKMGQAFPGERVVFRGFDLHVDLFDMSWLELNLFGITGKRFTQAELKVLDYVLACTSYPEPRIWNNRVATLAGTARTTSTQAMAAACAASEAQLFGLQIQHMCGDFLFRCLANKNAGGDLKTFLQDEIEKFKYIKGYGRPIAAMKLDERIPAVFRKMQEVGISPGQYTNLAYEVEECLQSISPGFKANYAIIASAIVMDLGLSVRELTCYMFIIFVAGMSPCYLEALERPEGATFAMKCDQIEYTGPGLRSW